MDSPLSSSPSSSSASPFLKKKATRCKMMGCTDRVVKIVGDCRYCNSQFCSRHRLPEAHSCLNLINVKKDSFERNADKLLQEKCVASKV